MRLEGSSAANTAKYLSLPVDLIRNLYSVLEEQDGAVPVQEDTNPPDLVCAPPERVKILQPPKSKRGRPAKSALPQPPAAPPPPPPAPPPVVVQKVQRPEESVGAKKVLGRQEAERLSARDMRKNYESYAGKKYPKSSPPSKTAMDGLKKCPTEGCSNLIKKSEEECHVCWHISLTGRKPLDPVLQYVGGELKF